MTAQNKQRKTKSSASGKGARQSKQTKNQSPVDNGAEEKLLSQEEIDTLLSGVDTDALTPPSQADEPETDSVRLYDFTRQQYSENMRLPGLDLLNERFARRFRVGLFNLLRCSVDIHARPIKPQAFSKFMNQLPMPTSMNIVNVRPLNGVAMFVLDAQLVYTLVDLFFGGNGKAVAKAEGRDFTATEIRIVRAFLRQTFTDLSSVWEPVLPLEFRYERFEQNPRFATILNPDELVVESAYSVDLEGAQGLFRILFTASMLEPIQTQLASNYQEAPPNRNDMGEVDHGYLEDIKTDLVARFGTFELTIGEIMSLEPGATFVLDGDSVTTVLASDTVLGTGRAGVKDGNYGVLLEAIENTTIDPVSESPQA